MLPIWLLGRVNVTVAVLHIAIAMVVPRYVYEVHTRIYAGAVEFTMMQWLMDTNAVGFFLNWPRSLGKDVFNFRSLSKQDVL